MARRRSSTPPASSSLPRQPIALGLANSGAGFASRTLTSDPSAVALARAVRVLEFALEAAVLAIVAISVLALASVHPWAYVPLWWACGLCALAVAAHVSMRHALRTRLGARHVALRGARFSLEPEPPPDASWDLDLAAPIVPRPPLLLPGLLLAALGAAQLLPLPPDLRPISVSPTDTAVALAFLSSLLALHAAASVAFGSRWARLRFRKGLALLALVLALVALGQAAFGARRIYGFFAPTEAAGFFGPFVNRNHFAGYMLLSAPITLDLLERAWVSTRRQLGANVTGRRLVLAVGSPAGRSLFLALVPVIACIGALVATTSRSGLIAFTAGLVLAGMGLRRKGSTPAWALAVVAVAVVATWFGMDRIGARFASAETDAPGRTSVWADAVRGMDGPQWLRGSGLNTFSTSTGRARPFALPRGATPWPPELLAAAAEGAKPGYRMAPGVPGINWYREAHNDYVQLLVETGLPGLLIGAWAAVRALRAVRHDPWVLAAVAGLLLQEALDFSLQIPAVAVLFAVLTALRSGPGLPASSYR